MLFGWHGRQPIITRYLGEVLDEGLPGIMRGELQTVLTHVYEQLDMIAGHLLPVAEAAKIKPVAAIPSRVRKVLDLMADYGGNGELW